MEGKFSDFMQFANKISGYDSWSYCTRWDHYRTRKLQFCWQIESFLLVKPSSIIMYMTWQTHTCTYTSIHPSIRPSIHPSIHPSIFNHIYACAHIHIYIIHILNHGVFGPLFGNSPRFCLALGASVGYAAAAMAAVSRQALPGISGTSGTSGGSRWDNSTMVQWRYCGDLMVFHQI